MAIMSYVISYFQSYCKVIKRGGTKRSNGYKQRFFQLSLSVA